MFDDFYKHSLATCCKQIRSKSQGITKRTVETGQMSAAETGQMSAVETRQMYSIKTGQRPVAIKDIYLVSTADICPVSAADICLVSTADICPVSAADIGPVSTADLSSVAGADIQRGGGIWRTPLGASNSGRSWELGKAVRTPQCKHCLVNLDPKFLVTKQVRPVQNRYKGDPKL